MPRCVGAASKQRAVFLKSACEDEALRCEVELLLATSLLRVHGRPYGSLRFGDHTSLIGKRFPIGACTASGHWP